MRARHPGSNLELPLGAGTRLLFAGERHRFTRHEPAIDTDDRGVSGHVVTEAFVETDVLRFVGLEVREHPRLIEALAVVGQQHAANAPALEVGIDRDRTEMRVRPGRVELYPRRHPAAQPRRGSPGHQERRRQSEALTGRRLAMARISRSGDTDETITIPRPDDRSTIQPQQTRKATMKDSHSPLRILPDGDDLERIIAHAPRREERRRLQLLAAERSYFDALETRHGRPGDQLRRW